MGKLSQGFLRVMKIAGYTIREIIVIPIKAVGMVALAIAVMAWLLSAGGLMFIVAAWMELSTIQAIITTVVIGGVDLWIIIDYVIKKYKL